MNSNQFDKMLNFIYYSKTSLLDGDLEKFLGLAEDFKIQGLGDIEPSAGQVAMQEEKGVEKEANEG